MKKSIGFIGGGKFTRLMLKGFDNRKVKFKRVILAESNPLVFERLRNNFPFVYADSAAVAAAQDIVFLDLEPNMLMDTLGLIGKEFKERAIIVSLVPDINIAKLGLRLPNMNRLVRVLPSSAIYINEAYTPVAFAPGFPVTEKDDVLELFGHLGRAVEVPEDKLHLYSAMAAVVPAYFWYQWKELISMGRELGLTDRETVDFLSDSVVSSLHLSHSSGLSDEQVADILPFDPIEKDETQVRELHRRRLVDLYRRARPEVAEERVTSTHGR